jgi:hypothetical protein
MIALTMNNSKTNRHSISLENKCQLPAYFVISAATSFSIRSNQKDAGSAGV